MNHKPKHETVAVYTCDIWKSASSQVFVGVFTDRVNLNKALRELIKKDIIEIDKDYPGITASCLNRFSVKELNTAINYVYLEETTTNGLFY